MTAKTPERVEYERLISEGVPPRDAARRAGLTRRQFSKINFVLGIKIRPLKTARSYVVASRLPIGSVREALLNEDCEFGEWLVAQVPEGGTIVDILMAIAKDAYHEEKNDE